MKNNINENELQKVILLMGYDTSKTLNENVKELNEQVPYANEFGSPSPGVDGGNVSTGIDSLQRKVKTIFGYCTEDPDTIKTIKRGVSDNNIKILYDRLYDAMDGIGTKDDKVYDALKSLLTMSDLCALNALFYSDRNGETLFEWLDGDFHTAGGWSQIYNSIKDMVEKTYKPNGVNPEGSEGVSPEGVDSEPQKIQYRPCTSYPFSIGCMNAALKEVQSCLGLKPDGMYGPKTMGSIKSKLPDFDGNITQDTVNTLTASCRQSQKDGDIPINKLEPRTTYDKSGVDSSTQYAPPINKLKPQTGSLPQSVSPKTVKVKTRADMTPEQIYNELKPELGRGRRLKYKGTLQPVVYDKLTDYLRKGGYTPSEPKPKDYGSKYVWTKTR